MFYECEPLECLPIQTPPPLHPSPSHIFETKTPRFIRPQMSLTRYVAAFFFLLLLSDLMCISNGELHNANADLQWRFCFFPHYSLLWKQNRLSSEWQVCFPVKIPTNSQPRYVLFLPSVWPSCSRMQSLYSSFSFLRLVGSPVLTSIVYQNLDDCQTNKQMTLNQRKWWGIH